MSEIYQKIKQFFADRENVLQFNILKKRPSCAYGRFDDQFEQLILSLREQYPLLSCEKDMPRADHPELSDDVFATPVFAHIAHSKSTDNDFNSFMRTEGNVLTIEIVEMKEENR